MDFFWRFSRRCSEYLGSAWAFIAAIVSIVVWAGLGPQFGYSDTWQLVINTATTIVTFLMVFLIPNTQNRDSKAINLKLDELLRGVTGARTGLVGLENRTEEQLDHLTREFKGVRARAARRLDEQTLNEPPDPDAPNGRETG
jgi:low affinity Fe/Cu permease